MSHTPGPWELAWEDGKHGVVGATTEGKMVFIVGIVGNGGENPDRNDERRANARLIAAAPDLLEACQILVEYAEAHLPFIGNNIAVQDRISEARAAIAKAIGDA